MRYVYVIGPSDGPYKIGIASNIASRLSALQTGCPVPLRVHMSAVSQDAQADESRLHQTLAALRMNGEWFSAKLHAIVDAFDRIGLQPSVDAPIRGEEAWDMPAPSFIAWLEAMASHPFYKSEHEAALALGVTDSAVEIMKREGADTRTALACRALLHRLEPYS